MSTKHIFSYQSPAFLKKYPGPVAWVNFCSFCKAEQPIPSGEIEAALDMSKKFIGIHKFCKPEKKEKTP